MGKEQTGFQFGASLHSGQNQFRYESGFKGYSSIAKVKEVILIDSSYIDA
jgi:hypothetical protein